jgi:hypothetical protein
MKKLMKKASECLFGALAAQHFDVDEDPATEVHCG